MQKNVLEKIQKNLSKGPVKRLLKRNFLLTCRNQMKTRSQNCTPEESFELETAAKIIKLTLSIFHTSSQLNNSYENYS